MLLFLWIFEVVRSRRVRTGKVRDIYYGTVISQGSDVFLMIVSIRRASYQINMSNVVVELPRLTQVLMK